MSNILFSTKMENYIFNSLYTKIFVSPCVYKLIIYIYVYIFSYSEAALHVNVWFGVGLEPSPRMYACMRCGALTNRATNDTKQHSRLHGCSYMSTHPFRHRTNNQTFFVSTGGIFLHFCCTQVSVKYFLV